ncbi:Formyltransferase/hydrolase complex subunit D [Novipirellula aureliae]|uniref:Formylmethanofuran--tetrahydromethanopterin formyltransferase n=1 Tax=Novipirellula aureliae TaxID=2527966 RepID=A0A5C6E8S2_9BACT|nr:formylmethanofuran--tetrahydromethanopterin N-formyltransferase [Novipirellula aureliae]TWU44964.1 Formyltransferase/hydrolase complex subunit D [Novipirellula aureliae]
MNPPKYLGGVEIDSAFAEAFDMKATRLVITAIDHSWAMAAANSIAGFATSVIACGIEIAIERKRMPDETPDGRPGVSVLAFAVSKTELENQIVRRAGQCVLTCPTTALYGGIEETKPKSTKRIAIGKSLRYFGDGHQISKLIEGRRYWRIPVMDGEFVCDHDVPRVDGIGGGNFILIGNDIDAVLGACRAAIDAMQQIENVIMPFPRGVTRSGSKMGSKYAKLIASTNDAYCPSLRASGLLESTRQSELRASESVAMEIVIDGLTPVDVRSAMRVGIDAACHFDHRGGLMRITAGNYGGKLGRHHFHLHEVV